MKTTELLRHVADNLEAGRNCAHGLLYKGTEFKVPNVKSMTLLEPHNYSLKPKVIMVNGIEVERGVTSLDELGDDGFVLVNPLKKAKYICYNSMSSCELSHYISLGLVFKKGEEEKAIALAEAMLSF